MSTRSPREGKAKKQRNNSWKLRSSDWLKQGLESEQTNKSLKQKLGQLEIEKKCHLHSVRNEPVRKKPATQFF